jgi:hypothetical protein
MLKVPSWIEMSGLRREFNGRSASRIEVDPCRKDEELVFQGQHDDFL